MKNEAMTQNLADMDLLYPSWKPQTLWECFDSCSSRFADSEFVVFDDDSFSYEVVRRDAIRYAKALQALGVHPGDHVAVMMYNSPSYVSLIFAISAAGAVKVPLNPSLGSSELHNILLQAGVDWLFCQKIPPISDDVKQYIRRIIIVGEYDGTDERICSVDQFLQCAGQSCAFTSAAQDPFSLCDILYTSGSTGVPKGVMITHDMLLRNSYGTARARCFNVGHRLFLPLPLFHVMAYSEGLLACMLMGGTAIFSSRPFDAHYMLQHLKKNRAEDIACMPITMQKLLSVEGVSDHDWPQLQSGYWTNCPEWIWKEAKRKFGIKYLTNAYGMSECGASITMVRPDDPEGTAFHSNGKIKPGGAISIPGLNDQAMELRIADFETGEPVPAGTAGEIQFRGPATTPGYYNAPALTRSAFTEDGWFKSEDIGILDQDGYLRFCGRNSDIYKLNGENVSPQFLDQVIADCPGVRAVECVGVSNDRCGAVGVAFVDMWDPDDADEAKLRDYCRSRLASYQIPKYIFFSDSSSWPRTSSNKILKSGLRELAQKLIK